MDSLPSPVSQAALTQSAWILACTLGNLSQVLGTDVMTRSAALHQVVAAVAHLHKQIDQLQDEVLAELVSLQKDLAASSGQA